MKEKKQHKFKSKSPIFPKLFNFLHLTDSIDILYFLCGVLFLLQFALVLITFFNIAWKMPLPLDAAFFFVLLLIYFIRNSVEQWRKKVRKKKRGHLFVIAWIIFVALLVGISNSSNGKYNVPFRAWENLIYIVSIFWGRNLNKFVIYLKNKKGPIRPYILLIFLGKKAMRIYCRWQKKSEKRKKGKKGLTPNLKPLPERVIHNVSVTESKRR